MVCTVCQQTTAVCAREQPRSQTRKCKKFPRNMTHSERRSEEAARAARAACRG